MYYCKLALIGKVPHFLYRGETGSIPVFTPSP